MPVLSGERFWVLSHVVTRVSLVTPVPASLAMRIVDHYYI